MERLTFTLLLTAISLLVAVAETKGLPLPRPPELVIAVGFVTGAILDIVVWYCERIDTRKNTG